MCFVVTRYDLSTNRCAGTDRDGSRCLREWLGMDSNCRDGWGWDWIPVPLQTSSSNSHKSPSAMRDQGPCLIQCFLGPHMSLPNGISFRPVALTGCTSVTDNTHTHTYWQMDRPRYGNICHNRWNHFWVSVCIHDMEHVCVRYCVVVLQLNCDSAE